MNDRLSTSDLEAVRDLVYRSLFDNPLQEVHVWKVVRGADGAIVTWRLVDANARALDAWGLDLEAIRGRTTEEIFPDARPHDTFLPIVTKIFETGEPHEWEAHFAATDQTLHMVSTPVGEYFVSTGFDISEMRHQQRDLSNTLLRLEQAISAGGVGLWEWDLVTDEVRYSDEWKAQLGYAPDEIEDRFEEWSSRCHPEDLVRALERIDEARDNRSSDDYSIVFRMRHRNGEWRWIHARATTFRADDGTALRMVGSHIDVTRERLLTEHVRNTQRLESLGTLAAGIAHDFNNILTAVTANLSLILDGIEDPELRGMLEEMDVATHRAQSLTNQLLTFSKGGAPVRSVAAIGDVVLDSARFVTHGSRAAVAFAIDEDLRNVEIDAGQISQVLSNLVINAVQAMPEGGMIDVSASNRTLGAGDPSGLPAGDYVEVMVRDEGPGIAEEDLPRIFDPFYTTKREGTGLGLATSYSIVMQHGGRILAESEPGAGATFRVLLPATTATPVSSPERERTRGGEGRVLVMDDEAPVARAAVRILSHLGYEASAVSDGDECLEVYRAAIDAGTPYDVVILDLTIPGKAGGEKVLERLAALDEEVTAIVSSGYGDNDVLANHEAYGFAGRLPKPFNTDTLGRELARVRAGAPPNR